jgi:hypothetical protein
LNRLNKSNFIMEEVIYGKLPCFSLNQRNIPDEELIKPLYHKLVEWKYEKEVRIYTELTSSERFFKFSPSSLKAIIIGDRFEKGINHRMLSSILAKTNFDNIITSEILRTWNGIEALNYEYENRLN